MMLSLEADLKIKKQFYEFKVKYRMFVENKLNLFEILHNTNNYKLQ